MAWETRGNQRYYYTAQRVGGRVVKSYVGCRLWVDSAAQLDELDRERRNEERSEDKRRHQEWEERRDYLWGIAARADELAALFIQVAGYHRHDRGRWRKKRMKAKNPVTANSTADTPLDVVNRAANSEDKSLTARAVALIQSEPENYRSHFLSDVSNAIERRAKGNGVVRQLCVNETDKMRKAFYEGREAQTIPFAERLIIERIIACRLALQQAEDLYSIQKSPVWAQICSKEIDRAHKRYLAAIKTLAEVRRLALPIPPSVSVALPGSTQVNIGEKQINLSTGETSPLNVTPGLVDSPR